MPKLKIFSGAEVIKIFETFGFVIDAQKGSHVKTKRLMADGTKQILTVPNHQEIDRGTLKAIFNQATRYISENELRKYFYTQ